MARERGIVIYPNPVLRARAKPVDKMDEFVRELVADMHRVVGEEEGAGIAAPQLGESLRIFLACPSRGEEPRVFINPKIEVAGAVSPHQEGCLSLPDIFADILRPAFVRITATALDGSEFSLESDGFAARVWQHEFDHLEGMLIIDRMRPIDRLSNRRALRDLERAGG